MNGLHSEGLPTEHATWSPASFYEPASTQRKYSMGGVGIMDSIASAWKNAMAFLASIISYLFGSDEKPQRHTRAIVIHYPQVAPTPPAPPAPPAPELAVEKPAVVVQEKTHQELQALASDLYIQLWNGERDNGVPEIYLLEEAGPLLREFRESGNHFGDPYYNQLNDYYTAYLKRSSQEDLS